MKCDKNKQILLHFEVFFNRIFQDEFDEIETAYTEEKRLLIELEERFEKLKEEYDKVFNRYIE